MEKCQSLTLKAGVLLAALAMMLLASSCSPLGLARGMIGRLGKYDYSPSVIQSGDVKQFWWCGYAVNPTDSSQESDSILYESVNSVTSAKTGPLTVMAETAGAWDSLYTCNPKVIGGLFQNPLGDGQSFTYAMYYVGTSDGVTNNIGVAFSSDGIKWSKYPQPVIRTMSPTGYGVGQPALYNADRKAAITMFYEDSNPMTRHLEATSPDGVHFTVQGTLTTSGLDTQCPASNSSYGVPARITAHAQTDPSSQHQLFRAGAALTGQEVDTECPAETWGDMAFDSQTGYWYAVFNRSLRDPSTTGGVMERGQLGVEIYKIADSSLLTGNTPWQQLGVIDTNLTGFESNFIAGFVRDQYGSVNVGTYPVIGLYVSVSNPQPSWDASAKDASNSAEPNQWDIAPVSWVPNEPSKPFYRYFNSKAHEVTTGWVSPYGSFLRQSLLGHLYESPQQGANLAFYGCKNGSRDYFVSLDSACEGQRIIGRNGYAYSAPNPALHLVALFRCSTLLDHFVSQDAKCEGATTDQLLGYVLP